MTISQLDSKANVFKVGDVVVYPTHGVGMIEAEEEEEIAGNKMSFFVVSTVKNKVTIRVPKVRASKVGLRHLSSKNELDEAIEILKQKSKAKKGNWPKIAQDYNSKINSGKPTLIAAVARDCYEGTSYSEKMLYKEAVARLATEYALATGIDEQAAERRITSILNYRV
jgi:CarD family transcriptional regulator